MGKSHIKPSWRNAASAALIALLIGGAVYAQTSATATTSSDDAAQHVRDMQNTVKSTTDWITGVRREIKDIQKETKADTSGANSFLDQYEACSNTLKGLINGLETTPFWDKRRECEDIAQDLQDLHLNSLRSLRDLSYVKENVKNRRKELKNVDRDIKDVQKQAPGCDISAATTARANAESLISQIEQIIAANNPDTVEDARDLERDLNDSFQEIYDGQQVCRDQANVVQSRKDLERNIKDKVNQLKDLNREFKNATKGVPEGDEVRVKLQGIITNYQTTLESYKQCVSNLGSGGDPQDCWDLNSTLDELCCAPEEGFWDVQNQIRQKGDLARCQKERVREHKNNVSQVKDLRREETRLSKQLGAEAVSELTQCINTYEGVLNRAGELIPTDQCNEYWNELQLDPWGNSEYAQPPPGGCWDLMNRYQRVGDIKRVAKDLSQQVKQNDQECNRIEKEAKRTGGDPSEVLGLCQEFRGIVENFNAAVTAGDTDKALEIQDYQLNDFWNRWGDALRNFWESSRGFDICGEIDNASGEILRATEHLNRLLNEGRIDEGLYKDCSGFIGRGKELADVLENACANRDEAAIEKGSMELEKLGELAEFRCAALFDEFDEGEEIDYGNYEERFEDVHEEDLRKFGEKISENFREDVFEKVVAQFQEQILQQVMEKILGTLEEGLKARMAVMLENLAAVSGGEVSAEEIVQTKLSALDCASSIKELSGRKGGEKLREVISQIERATLGSETGSQLQSLCESFVSSAKDLKGSELTDVSVQLADKVSDILGRASKEAVAQGITCFADIPVDEWYHKEVCGAADLGIFEKGEPGRDVNVAEVLKITAKVLGESVDSPGKGEQWFAPYCSWAEAKGLTVNCGKQAGRVATRAEVVRIVLEAAGIRPEKVANTGFTDVSAKHPHAAYIAEAASRKIVVGTMKDGKRVFFPDKSVVRAEMAAISRKAFLALGAIPEEESDVFEGRLSGDDEDDEDSEDEDEDEEEEDFDEEDFR